MIELVLYGAGFVLIIAGALSVLYPLRWLRIRTRGAALMVIAGGLLFVAVASEMTDSYMVYLGFTLFIAGVLSLIRPLRFLHIPDRRWALAVAGLGLLTSLGVLALPYRNKEAATHITKLDDWMPRWQVAERHTMEVTATPEKVFLAIRAVRADEITLFRTLIAIRRCGEDGGPESILNAPEEKPLLDVATQTTFVLLEEKPPRELVVGTIIAAPRDARVSGRLAPDLFRTSLQPGWVLATMNFAVAPNTSGGSTVSTETRIYANSQSALRRFGIYWRLIHPGSDIIRRMWLRAIRLRAEGEGLPG